MSKSVLHTSLCDDLKIEYPIFLAGMGVKGHATPPELVAAVSEAGGMGILGCSWLDGDEVRRRIRAVRNLTDRPFGVDLLLPASMADGRAGSRRDARADRARLSQTHGVRRLPVRQVRSQARDAEHQAMSPEFIRRQVDVCLEERIAVFAAGLGDPSWVVPLAHQVGMKVHGPGRQRPQRRAAEEGRRRLRDRARLRGRRPHRHHRQFPADPHGRRCGQCRCP